MSALRANLDLYLETLPKLIKGHEGKYALVCNGKVSVFETADEATEAAREQYDDPSKFLVIKIEPPSQGSQMNHK